MSWRCPWRRCRPLPHQHPRSLHRRRHLFRLVIADWNRSDSRCASERSGTRSRVDPSARRWTAADGTLPNGRPSEPRYGRAWIDESVERRQVLESDPFYRLAGEVAGRTGRRRDDLLDLKNITDHIMPTSTSTATRQQLENATLESIDAFGGSR